MVALFHTEDVRFIDLQKYASAVLHTLYHNACVHIRCIVKYIRAQKYSEL